MVNWEGRRDQWELRLHSWADREWEERGVWGLLSLDHREVGK